MESHLGSVKLRLMDTPSSSVSALKGVGLSFLMGVMGQSLSGDHVLGHTSHHTMGSEALPLGLAHKVDVQGDEVVLGYHSSPR